MFRRLLSRLFNSSSAREHEYHVKPTRPVSCVFSYTTQDAEEQGASPDRFNQPLIEPIDHHSPSPPKTDQSRSIPGIGIYPNANTRQKEHIAYVSVLDVRFG